MEEEKQQQYIQASPHFLWRSATVLQLNRRSLGARLGIDMSSATTGETEMFSGAEIHICARRKGCFYLKSRAEQAVKAELESLHHGSAADSAQTTVAPSPIKTPSASQLGWNCAWLVGYVAFKNIIWKELKSWPKRWLYLPHWYYELLAVGKGKI